MNSPVSSSTPTSTVEAFSYETQVYAEKNTYDRLTIYIPSFDFSVSNDGRVSKCQLTSKKATIADKQYWDECHSGRRQQNVLERLELLKKNDAEASKNVRISRAVVEEINLLMEEQEPFMENMETYTKNEARIDAIDANIKRLAQRLF